MRDLYERPPQPLNAYVSASSRGLALEIARRLARDGANVAISSRDSVRLETARHDVQAAARPGARVLGIPGDLSRPADQDRILETLREHDFQPHVFVCNSGLPAPSRLDGMTRAQWDHDVEMILGQAVFASRAFAPAMAAAGYGRFIFISSIFAKTPSAEFLTSSIARAGLFALSKMLVAEHAAHGVASFPICLGHVDTPLVRNMALGRPLEGPVPLADEQLAWGDRYDEWANLIPAGRIASMSELAAVVAFLLSPAAEYLNGSVLSFSGGMDRGLT